MLAWRAYIHQGIPSLPEITVSNHTDSLTQLSLYTKRNRDHQTDQFLLDSIDLIQLKLVISIFIRPVSLDKILEAQGAGQASVVGEGSGRCDVEELQRKAWFFLFLTKSKLGYKKNSQSVRELS